MAELHIHLDCSMSRTGLRNVLAAFLMLLSSTELSSESVTLSTYYPAPSGVYTNMITTSNTYLARDAAGKVGVGMTGVGADAPASKLHVKGDLALSAQAAGAARSLPAGATMIWSDGGWVRINQNLDYSVPSGLRVYTPSMAVENLNIGGAAGYGAPGNGEIWANSHIRTNGRLIVGSLGTPTAQIDVNSGVVRSQQACILVVFAPTGFTSCPGNYYATYSEGFWARNILYSGSTSGLTSGEMYCCLKP